MNIRKEIGRVVRAVLLMPLTLFINFRCLPLKQAIHLPIIVMSYCSFAGLKPGAIEIKTEKVHTGMIKVGALCTSITGLHTYSKCSIKFKNNGKIVFYGNAGFGKGTAIYVGGEINFGNNFSCNNNCFFSCDTKFLFDEDVLMGWNVSIRDSDGHQVLNEVGVITNSPKPVIIGSNVWISSYANILKGVTLAHDVVIGYGSIVTKSIEESNVVAAGNPAKVIKHNIRWIR